MCVGVGVGVSYVSVCHFVTGISGYRGISMAQILLIFQNGIACTHKMGENHFFSQELCSFFPHQLGAELLSNYSLWLGMLQAKTS